MIIEIESRATLEQRAALPLPPNTAIICITDFDNTFAELKNRPDHLLQIKFDDMSIDVFRDMLDREPTAHEQVIMARKYHAITRSQAEEIAAFYKDIEDKTETLICQCEFGQSRSAACAAAILQYRENRGIDIFADINYYPNKLVYKMVYEALSKH